MDRVDTIDDKAEWTEVMEGCRIIGLDEGEREDILQLLAAILHLGNLQFEVSRVDVGGCICGWVVGLAGALFHTDFLFFIRTHLSHSLTRSHYPQGFHTQQGTNASKLLPSPALNATCGVLGCQAAQLETVLTQRVLSTALERVVKPLTVSSLFVCA